LRSDAGSGELADHMTQAMRLLLSGDVARDPV
jgi:hypothetical protein